MLREMINIVGNVFKPGKNSSWRVVVLCMMVATTFWFFNALNKDNYLTKINFPIQIQYDDSLYVPVKPLPEMIRIEVTGGGWSLLRKSLGFEMIPMPIVVENPEESRYIVPSNLSLLITERLGSDTRLLGVLSDTIFLNIERYQTRKLFLEVDTLALSLAENYSLKGKIYISPDSVSVTGPRSFVAALPQSLFINIPEKNILTTYQSEVSVGSLGSELYYLSPNSVKVQFDVVETVEAERQVDLSLINFYETLQVEPSTAKVKVKFRTVKDSLVSALAYPWEIGLDYERRSRTDSTVKPYLIAYPPFVKSITIEPLSVDLIKK
jgi:YbbR domain-containing protein